MAAQRLTAEQRSEALARYVAQQARSGWRVSSQTVTQAQLVKGHRTNHVLHLILTIITLGIWAIVWLLMAIFGGEKYRFVSVDEYGNVSASALLSKLPAAVEPTPFDPMTVTRECPHCKSAIRPDASVCPHCQRESEPWTLKDGYWWLSVDGRWNWWNHETREWVPAEDQPATPTA
jgi:hypothetical protein